MTTSSASRCSRALLLLLPLAGPAFGEAVSVDVAQWAEVGTGETIDGWSVVGLDRYAKYGGVKFDAAADVALSPLYGGFVTQVVAEVACGTSYTQRYLTLTPEIAAIENPRKAVATDECLAQVFTWPASDRVRRFRFTAEGHQSAYWAVCSCVVYLQRLETPTGLEDDPAWCDALATSWQADSRATLHTVEAWEVIRTPFSGDELACWDFSELTNGVGKTMSFDDLGLAQEYPDVTGEKLCLQGGAFGHLQVGMNSVAGEMRLPLPTASERTCEMELYAHETDKEGRITVRCTTAGEVTNELETVFLLHVPSLFRMTLPDEARVLVLPSMASRRIRVRRVRVLSDYAPETVSTNLVAATTTRGTGCTFKKLQEGHYVWRVMSREEDGMASLWSDWRDVVLDSGLPSFDRPGFLLFLH